MYSIDDVQSHLCKKKLEFYDDGQGNLFVKGLDYPSNASSLLLMITYTYLISELMYNVIHDKKEEKFYVNLSEVGRWVYQVLLMSLLTCSGVI